MDLYQYMFVHIPDGIRELCIGDEEGGDSLLMEQLDQSVDLGVHDGLPHKREGAVLWLHPLRQTLQLHSRHSWEGVKVRILMSGLRYSHPGTPGKGLNFMPGLGITTQVLLM